MGRGRDLEISILTDTSRFDARHPAEQLDDMALAADRLDRSLNRADLRGQATKLDRFADAAHDYAAAPPPRDLRHHGDAEVASGLLDFAVNVYAGPRPTWLDEALHHAVDAAGAYPDATQARSVLGARHRRPVEEVLPTAGAAEAFFLIAGLRPWRHPVMVHPQFTEPHLALEQAGHTVTSVLCSADDDFALHPDMVPDNADLVIIGNPTNPTGVLHPAQTLRALLRPGRVLVVDEAFMDAVPGQPHTMADERTPGLLVTRSLTKHWSIPGIRAGYLLGDPDLITEAALRQVPWSVSTPAIAAMVACSDDRAAREAQRRAEQLWHWHTHLVDGLQQRGVRVVPGEAPFVLAQVGHGVHPALRATGMAVRRADTFPGLDADWIRIAVRDQPTTDRLLAAFDRVVQRPLPISQENP